MSRFNKNGLNLTDEQFEAWAKLNATEVPSETSRVKAVADAPRESTKESKPDEGGDHHKTGKRWKRNKNKGSK